MKPLQVGIGAVIFMGLALMVNGSPAFSREGAEPNNNVQEIEEKPLRSAVFGFAPWGMTEDGQSIGSRALPEGQKYAGVMPDMISAVSEAINEPVELVAVSYTRMFALLNSGQVDFAFFFRSQDSEKIAVPLVKTHELRTVVVASPETVLEAKGLLGGLIFALPRSVRYSPIFDRNREIQRIYTLDYTDAVRLLDKKRVSAIVGPDIFLSYSFQTLGLEAADYVILQELAQNDVYLHFSKRSPLAHKANKVATAVDKLVERGAFERILIKYFKSLEVPFGDRSLLAPSE